MKKVLMSVRNKDEENPDRIPIKLKNLIAGQYMLVAR